MSQTMKIPFLLNPSENAPLSPNTTQENSTISSYPLENSLSPQVHYSYNLAANESPILSPILSSSTSSPHIQYSSYNVAPSISTPAPVWPSESSSTLASSTSLPPPIPISSPYALPENWSTTVYSDTYDNHYGPPSTTYFEVHYPLLYTEACISTPFFESNSTDDNSHAAQPFPSHWSKLSLSLPTIPYFFRNNHSSTKASRSLNDLDEFGNHIPRPPNSWMIYRTYIHERLSEQSMAPITATKVSNFASNIWKNLRPAERAYWDDLAAQATAALKLRYPHYKFSPRRDKKEKKCESNKRGKKKGAKRGRGRQGKDI